MLHQAPETFWLMAAGVPLAVFLAWAEIKLPALVVAEVTTGQTFRRAAAVVGALLGGTLLVTMLRDFLTAALNGAESRFRLILRLVT